MEGMPGLLAEMWIPVMALGLILAIGARRFARLSLLHEDGICLALRIIGAVLIALGAFGMIDFYGA